VYEPQSHGLRRLLSCTDLYFLVLSCTRTARKFVSRFLILVRIFMVFVPVYQLLKFKKILTT